MTQLNSIVGTFFTTHEKLLPPVITGLVTISIFVFTIWKDKIKEGRKKRKENSQKNVYLMNLLDDVVHHIQDQLKYNQDLIDEVESTPTKFCLLTYLPVSYLERLTVVLANDSYFSAFNSKYANIEEADRIRIYNDLAIDVDLFYVNMKELYLYIERGSANYQEFKNKYLEAAKSLLKKVTETSIKVDDRNVESMDKEDLLEMLNQIDFEQFVEALRDHDLVILDKGIKSLHKNLVTCLRPDFDYITSVTKLCESCQDANEQFHGLVNTNVSLKDSISDLNNSMQKALEQFTEKLNRLKSAKI